MRILPSMCAPIELSISLPWINRHRPYLALHFAMWGHGCGPHPTTIYHVGIMWGRYFTEKEKAFWFDVKIPRRRVTAT